MSYETLTVGNIEFKKDIDPMTRSHILIALRNEIEGTTEYNSGFDYWTFEEVNWTSHVKAEQIEELIRKYKDHIRSFACSIFYLEKSDESVIMDNGEITSQIIRRP